jgi:hypothetical protein
VTSISGLKEKQIIKVVVAGNVEEIGESCFSECESLKAVIFEDECNLKRIEKQAFWSIGHRSIRIPSNVEFIGESCFSYSQSLSEVIFARNSCLKEISRMAFSRSGLECIEVPDQCEILDGAFFGLKSVSISSSNPFFIVEGGFVFSRDKRKIIRYFGHSSSIVIPVSVEIIGDSSFSLCTSLNKIIFRSDCKLKRIDQWAFSSLAVKSIRIPSSVEFIGESCFAFSESLTEVIFEDDCQLKTVDQEAFAMCGLRSIRIPSKVEFIGELCFYACKSLNEVVFEGEVEIGDAFFQCPLKCVKLPVGVKLNYSFCEHCRIEYVTEHGLLG